MHLPKCTPPHTHTYDLKFCAVFSEVLAKIICWCYVPSRVGVPFYRESWIHSCITLITYELGRVQPLVGLMTERFDRRTVLVILAVADPGFSPRSPIYDFAKFSQKLHTIDRIWVPGGRGGVGACIPASPLRSTNVYDRPADFCNLDVPLYESKPTSTRQRHVLRTSAEADPGFL